MSEDGYLNLQPGTIVNGRYEIVKCLGAGSMGMVYACRHRELSGHLVALKVLFSEVARDTVQAARFRNEIVASYGVSHPNVVRAYEYFRDGDLIAYTMEYISGGDLADRISVENPLPITEIIRMLGQMCAGVQAIHNAGIVHRDLKPENILLTAQGDIKITDFGIARMDGGRKLTEHGGVVGTIDYVSPEYLERGQVDARSDIYALGVLAYEMVTGESPFKGKSVVETMTMRLRTDPKPPHQVRSDCPPALGNIILKAMSRVVEKRYQSAAEMLNDLNGMSQAPSVEIPKPIQMEATSGGVTAGAASGSTEGVGRKVKQIKPLGASVPPVTGNSNSSATNSAAKLARIPAAQPIERLDSVLKPNLGAVGRGSSPARVSISESHLSSDQLKRLSEQIASEPSMTKGVIVTIIVMLLGFALGYYVFTKYYNMPTSPLGTNDPAWEESP